MLSDDKIQLLTAYVDGELNARRRQSVLRLLYQSSEARELVRQLQENAHKVQQLPRHKLDRAFAADVLAAIAERRVTPTLPMRRPLALRLRWVPYAVTGVAAAIVFAVVLGGALYVAVGMGADGWLNPGDGMAKHEGVEPLPHLPVVEPQKADQGSGEAPAPVPPPRKLPNPLIARVVEGVYQQYAVHMPPERSFTFRVAELDKAPVVKEVAAALKKDEAVQLDLSVRNHAAAMERLQAVLKKHKIDLVVDPGSSTALKQAPGKTELLLYAENLKADEWEQILKELAHEEKKAANPFDKVTVAALAPRGQRQVTELLGTDPTKRVDPSETKNIQPPKIKPKNPPPKKANRVAVVLPQSPQAKASEEVRRFLLQPARPEPGSIRVLLRIRPE